MGGGGGSATSAPVRSLRAALLASAPEVFTSVPGIFPWRFLLKHSQPGNKTGIVSGVFVMDTECMKCFLVGWEPLCLQEQHFEEAKKTRTDISLFNTLEVVS